MRVQGSAALYAASSASVGGVLERELRGMRALLRGRDNGLAETPACCTACVSLLPRRCAVRDVASSSHRETCTCRLLEMLHCKRGVQLSAGVRNTERGGLRRHAAPRDRVQHSPQKARRMASGRTSLRRPHRSIRDGHG
ncbi:hypothetical protein BV20DRAFT_699304 [Pilatotrama ljubarskyi]|nr:hypothetical protein BV20DRAFT_699304 [Pilatotrama ljubarskyi]